jgi:hypothetical protein
MASEAKQSGIFEGRIASPLALLAMTGVTRPARSAGLKA